MKHFQDFTSLVVNPIPQEKKEKYIDTLLGSITQQTKSGTKDIKGLQVRIRATHAGRLTGHFHYYSPAKMKLGADTFIKPYEKPFLTHHATLNDAIGRVKSATYIATPNALIPHSILQMADQNVVHNKKNLSYIKKLERHLFDRQFEGLGYISVVANITDEDAIRKILDGRYHTVSVGYDTNTLHCSICSQDWLSEGPCDHKKGQVYDNRQMFLIFGDLTFSEISYVNEPADELAANEEVNPINITLKDGLRGIASQGKRNEIIKSALSDQLILAPERVALTQHGLYMYDSISGDYIPVLSEIEQNSGDLIMKIKDLLALGADFYSKIVEHLPEGKSLTAEELSSHADTDFVGTNRTFPAFDVEHIDACKKLLESVEESTDRTEMLSFLDTRLSVLQAASQTGETEVTEDTTVVDNAPVVPVVETTDHISYNFELRGGNWGLPDGEEKSTDKEKEILKLLMSLYEGDVKDYQLSLYKDKSDEEKLAIVKEFADGILGEGKFSDDKIIELEGQLKIHKSEYAVAQDALKKQQDTITKLSADLKDFYVKEIMTFKAADSKVDPNGQIQSEEVFKDMSLSEVKASYAVVSKLFDRSTETVVITEVQDTSDKIQKSYTDAEIEEMRKLIIKKTAEVKTKFGDAMATNYEEHQFRKLNKLIAEQKTETK